MPAIDQTIALLDSAITLEDLDRLPPVQLRRFAALCHHWHMLADARAKPKTVAPVARAGEHASVYDPGSYEGRHDYAPGTLNAIYLPKPEDQP